MKDLWIYKILKNIIIGFLVVVFMIGVFNQALINYFIPKVYLEEVVEGARIYSRRAVVGSAEAKKIETIKLGRDVIVEKFEYLTGQYIKIGMPLFKIDPNFGIEDISAIIQPVKDQLQSLNAQSAIASERLAGNREKQALTKSEIEDSQNMLLQYKILFEQNAISKSEYDGHQKSHQALKDQLTSLEMESTQLVSEIRGLKTQIEAAEASLGQEQVLLEYIDNVDEQGVFYSPYNGVILSQAPPGDIIDGSQPIMEVALVNSYQDVYFNLLVSQELADDLGMYRTFYFAQDNAPEEEWNKVQVIYKSYIPVGDKILVRLEFKDKNGIPYMGDEIKGDLITRTPLVQYVVPKSAIRQSFDDIEGGGTFVYVVEEKHGVLGTEQVVKEIPVTVGASDDYYIAVNSTAARLRNLQVVKNLNYRITDNQRVLVVEE
ncbi:MULTISPECIES: efflux RND transporter periplasmic adaptor subunit [unclassified Fusibacter]|uniref:efflux RND transporter periplasmic adaptor subunit n=1 Tax=unclassified Fusibacter TaxID=2624464 RepID=UPI0010126A30|nr:MULTISPECIES: hypothetical protein [unclassified Fusibacter]MCK8061218.1 hypothetical protein [Fusibacter sp. A2]NPE23438.1 hypothetical protein [Fusibacter sp. A1]RXV59217.1 hypothetical protein DWB64_16605 [Fusibacter sp. A1]